MSDSENKGYVSFNTVYVNWLPLYILRTANRNLSVPPMKISFVGTYMTKISQSQKVEVKHPGKLMVRYN